MPSDIEGQSRDRGPLSRPLAEGLREIAERLAAAEINWLLTGSAMRALRGFDLIPRDIDIEVAATDVAAAAAALDLPAPRIESGGGVQSMRSVGRRGAFEVDVTADLTIDGPAGGLGADFPRQWAASARAEVDGQRVPLAPLEEALARAAASGDEERRRDLLADAPADLSIDEAWIASRLGG